MQLRNKSEFPLESLTNDSNSLPNFPALDSSSTPEDSKNLLPDQYSSDQTDLTPPTPLPLNGRGELDTPFLLGEGQGERLKKEYLLPDNSELVPLIHEKLPDVGNKKQHTFESRYLKKAPDVSKNKRRCNPIIEWLIAFLVLGILGAIALPSLTSCTNKAKQAEAKNNIVALNRAQQAYFLEYQKFTTDMAELGVSIKNPSINYSYSIRATKNAVFNYAISRKGNNKSYVGAVFAVPATNLDPKADKKEMITVAIACEAIRLGTTQPAAPTLQKGIPTCSEGTKDLAKS